MKVKKAFRFRIYPNKKQITFIHKTIGCSRFVYNYFTGKQKEKDHYWHTVNEMDTKTKTLKNLLCVHGRVISVNAITKEIRTQAGIFVKKHCD
ncbi:Helix-turn-helix domain protein [Oceanobacillus oncorhynchi]|uniref:Helix-turn-helix domain protein n=1 Tax=Oceanobacillus oncorhynchi TaxID=545501 RepID=A0A0A1MQU7_9BACI|nr:Helix-turn-helix domain protein [Oceanobacillus oncorhynchi]